MDRYSKYGLISVSLVLAALLSPFFIASPVFATSATPPSSPVTVQQGKVFLLRGSITFDKADTGYFIYGPVYWKNYGDPAENFRLENTPSVYWSDGTPVENIAISDSATPDGWKVDIADNGSGIARNGTFYIDIWLRAASLDGTPHRLGNQYIYFPMDQITLFEPGMVSVSAHPITVQVLGRGVDVSISPDNQSGVPLTTLNYTVTVTNTGNMGKDNYNLTVSDNAGWGGSITLDNTRLENIPENENRTATLHVHIPENAIGRTRDNITIKATSQGDNTKKDNASCIAHVTIVRVVNVSISSTYQENLPGAPLTYTVTVKNKGNVTDTYTLGKSDNAGWTLSLPSSVGPLDPDEYVNVTLTITIPDNATACTQDNITVTATSQTDPAVENENSCIAHAVAPTLGVDVSISPTSKSGLPGSTLTYTVTVKNTGNVSNNYSLTKTDNAVWTNSLSKTSVGPLSPNASENVTLSVTVPDNAPEGTRDNVTVTATSTENSAVNDNASCIAQAIASIRRGVQVLISPNSQDNENGGTLTYTVTVTNTGNVTEDYNLAVDDDAGWTLTLAATATGVIPDESRAVTLTVGIPSDAENNTRDNITVTATSSENTAIENSATCVARCIFGAAPITGVGVQVTIDSASKSGAPGEVIDFLITVTNTGASTDTFTLTATDTENWGQTLSVTSTTLAAGTSRQNIGLSITIPSAAADGDSTTITVTAASTDYENSAMCTATATGAQPPRDLVPIVIGGAAVGGGIAIAALLKKGILHLPFIRSNFFSLVPPTVFLSNLVRP